MTSVTSLSTRSIRAVYSSSTKTGGWKLLGAYPRSLAVAQVHQPRARHGGQRRRRPIRLALGRYWYPVRRTRPLVPFFRPKALQLSDFGRPRACSCNDTPYESEITTARLRLKSHQTEKAK